MFPRDILGIAKYACQFLVRPYHCKPLRHAYQSIATADFASGNLAGVSIGANRLPRIAENLQEFSLKTIKAIDFKIRGNFQPSSYQL